MTKYLVLIIMIFIIGCEEPNPQNNSLNPVVKIPKDLKPEEEIKRQRMKIAEIGNETPIGNYNKSITYNSSSFYAFNGIAKVFFAQGEFEKALSNSKKSIEIAEACNARRWILNQLIATLEDIESETKK